jgi:hypothetical protein
MRYYWYGNGPDRSLAAAAAVREWIMQILIQSDVEWGKSEVFRTAGLRGQVGGFYEIRLSVERSRANVLSLCS